MVNNPKGKNNDDSGGDRLHSTDKVIEEKIRDLIKNFKSPYFDQRESAKNALIEIGEPIVRNLIALLEFQHSYEVRIAAAEALGKIGGPRAVTALIPVLEDWQDYKYSLRT